MCITDDYFYFKMIQLGYTSVCLEGKQTGIHLTTLPKSLLGKRCKIKRNDQQAAEDRHL